MIFLQPAVLFLSALIGIPFIIHLVGERKYRPFSFSSLKFLREIERDSLQKLKLRQWLILLSRALWILMLILAFANPFFSSASGGLEPGILLVDKSYSTQQDNSFISASESFKEEYKRWHTIEYDEHTSMDTLGRMLQDHILNNKLSSPNIILLSDFQDNGTTQGVIDLINTFPARTIYISIIKKNYNAAISRLYPINDMYEKDQKQTLGIKVLRNIARPEPEIVYISINGKQLGRVALSEDGNGTFRFDTGDAPFVSCLARCEEDDYPGDNTRYAILKTNQQIRILCISDGEYSGYQSNAFFAMKNIDLTSIPSEKLTSFNLNDYDMVYLSDLYSLPLKQHQALLSYAENHPLFLTAVTAPKKMSEWTPLVGSLEQTKSSTGFLTIGAMEKGLGFESFQANEFRVLRYWKSTKKDLIPLWTLNQGDPLLAQCGKNIYVLFSPFFFDWNEMGLSPYFTLALDRFVEFAVNNENLQFTCGEAIALPRPQYKVTTPGGEQYTVQGQFTETQTPGFYTLQTDEMYKIMAANIPEEECIQAVIKTDSSRTFRWNENSSDTIRNAIKGRNAQTLFYILAGLFIMLEMMLLHKGEKTTQ